MNTVMYFFLSENI